MAQGVVAKAVKAFLRDAAGPEIKVGARDMLGKGAEHFDANLTKDLGGELRDALGKTFDREHPGPLSAHHAGTFADGTYTVGMTDEWRRFKRAGDANAEHTPHLGQFWSDTTPTSVEQTRREMAVLPEWPDGGKSPLNTGFEDAFPPGTVFYYGEVASQGGKYVGGGMQYLIQEPWKLDPAPVPLAHWPLDP